MTKSLKLKLIRIINNTPLFFSLTALIFGFTFVVAVPPLVGIDEPHHFTRTYQLAMGEMSSTQQDKMGGGQIPKNIVDYANLAKDIRKKKTKLTYKNLLKKAYTTNIDSEKVFYNFPGSAAYNLFAYLPAVLGVITADFLNLNLGLTIALCRIFMLATYVAIVAYAIHVLRDSRLKWVVLTISLLPSSIFLASTINADSLIIALSMLIFAAMAKSLKSKKLSRRESITMFAATLLLPLIKFNYWFISAVILLVPDRAILRSKINKIDTLRKARWLKFLVLTITGVLSSLWVMSVSWSADTIRAAGVGPNSGLVSDQVSYLLHAPWVIFRLAYNTFFINGAGLGDDYLYNLLGGRLGFNNVPPPFLVSALAFLLIVFAALYAKKEALKIRRQLLISTLLCLLVAGSIFASLYLSFSKIGGTSILGIQGRYFLPVVAFVVAYLATFAPIKLEVGDKLKAKFVLSGALWLNLFIACYYYFIVTYFGKIGF